MQPIISITEKQADYELLDSGDGKKLERYGKYVLARPDPEAIWNVQKPKSVWDAADAVFIRRGKEVEWRKKKSLPKEWNISMNGLIMEIRPTSFKHVGIFPEQSENWKWMEDAIARSGKKQAKVLNLFGYTGGATLACARAGAEVVHLDASKSAVAWARKNAELSGLVDAPIRYIVDDAMAFVKREIKRGNRYDAILMDPPSFGHGPKDELWKIEEHLKELLEYCHKILSDKPIFFLLNGYTAGYSPIAYENCLREIMQDFNGTIEHGELAIAESGTGRLLPAGMFARWESRDSI